MEAAIIVYPILILLSLLVLAIPVIIGVYIHKDAKKRGMNAVLWTLIGVLAPGFIGLIIYLIVRGEHPDLQCYSCGKPVNESFSDCPFCGAPLKEKCGNCGYTLDANWNVCASCGAEIPEEQRHRTTVRKKSGGLKWLLALVIAVPLMLMVMLFAATCLFVYEVRQSGCGIEAYNITKTAIYEDQEEILNWLSDCDAKGDGVYVLRCDFREGALKLTNLLVYRNDGYHEISFSTDNGGVLTSPELNIEYYASGFESRQDYTLTACRFDTESDNAMWLGLYDIDYDGNSTHLQYELTESDTLDFVLTYYFDEGAAIYDDYCTVTIAEELTEVYAVSADLWVDDCITEGETATNAEGGNIAGESFTFSRYNELEDADYSLVVTLFGGESQDNILFETEPIPLSEDFDWNVAVMFSNDENGEIVYKFKN